MNEQFLMFRASPSFLEATADKPMPEFSMTAYTGGAMRVKGFPHPVVVDLNGLDISAQNLPIRLDHKPTQGVGHSTRIAVEDGKLVAEGLISRDTSWARDVANSGKHGFPWQASIGGPVVEAELVPDGCQVEVNGQTFEGPVHVVRKMQLREISFVDQGADENTTAVVHAHMEEGFITAESEDGSHTQKKEVKMKSEIEAKCQNDASDQRERVFGNGAEAPSAVQRATLEEAPPAGEPTHPNPEMPVIEAKKVVDEAVKFDTTAAVNDYRKMLVAERTRISAIETVGKGKFPDMEAIAIAEGWTPEQFELAFLRKNRPEVPAIQASKPTMNNHILEAVALGASGVPTSFLETKYDAPTLEASEKLRGIGLQEFCEIACQMPLPRFRRDAHGWLEAAFSTAALPGILSNIANKMLLEGYNYVEDAWRHICKIASVTDFKQHSRYRMNGSFRFEKVGPGGELKHGQIDEQVYSQKADTHGIMFALTRQMIIDDDLGALTDIPRQIGIGAAEAIADAVWSLLLSNPIQRDGKTFFHNAHSNTLTGDNTNLSIDSLTAAEIKFGEQTKPNGRPLGATPSILLVPTALKVIAELLMKSTTLNEMTNVPKPNANPHTGKYTIVSSTYLGNSSFDGASSKAWYLLADPNRLPALEVAFLGGMDRPTIERADADFNTLGVQFRGYIDFGVREQDHRAILKIKGEA
ncbi:MAG: hypothetical protein Q4G59_05475 [Planctomycetia bacterium]|nr:hypothetical protein [Planctomycetia bacterium]